MFKTCPLIMIARAIQWSAEYVSKKDELGFDDAPENCSECLTTDCAFWTTTHEDEKGSFGACSFKTIAQSLTQAKR